MSVMNSFIHTVVYECFLPPAVFVSCNVNSSRDSVVHLDQYFNPRVLWGGQFSMTTIDCCSKKEMFGHRDESVGTYSTLGLLRERSRGGWQIKI